MRQIVESRVRAAGQLLHLIGRAGAGAVILTLLVHIAAGLASPAVILGSGLVVDAATGTGASLLLGVLVCAIGLLVQQAAAPVQVAMTSRIGLRVDAYCSQRLVESVAATSNLRSVEDPLAIRNIADATDALDQREMTPGGAAAGALALTARYVQLFATIIILASVVSVQVALLGMGVALLNRFGQTFGFSAWSAAVRRFAPAKQRMSYLRNLLTNPQVARDMQMLNLAPWTEDRYRTDAKIYLRPLWKARRSIYGSAFVAYAILSLAGASGLIAISVIHLHAGGGIPPGKLAIVLQTAIVCVLFGGNFPESDAKMQYGREAWEALLRAEAALASVSLPVTTAVREPNSLPAKRLPAEIVLTKVVYGYTPGSEVLSGVTLRLEAGRSTALVGINGCGKSTLVKLIGGFYVPASGSVTLDGVELDTRQRLDWQSHIAIVFQDFIQYQLTLRQNVAMQASGNSDDDVGIIKCLEDVGLAHALRKLRHGLDTPLSRLLQGGADFSGGEWQRLALARALFAVRHGARALILDEPTSQLDARGEAEFFSRFIELTHGVTTLVISHRFSSVRQADTIAVLSKGMIIESGGHQDLLRQNGAYARMYAVQSSRFAVR